VEASRLTGGEIYLPRRSVRGRSSTSMRPCRRHPTVASHDRVRATGEDHGGSDAAGLLRQASNHAADEHGSISPTAVRCFLKFIKT